jgi:hypothetical protein
MNVCILDSNKKAGVIDLHRVYFCWERPAAHFSPKFHLVAVAMQRTNNLSHEIHVAFAERFSPVRAIVLYRRILISVPDHADSDIVNNYELWPAFLYVFVTFFLAFEDFDPLHVPCCGDCLSLSFESKLHSAFSQC